MGNINLEPCPWCGGKCENGGKVLERKEANKMKHYHKIDSIFKRDPETNFKTFLLGEYSQPEFEYLTNCEWVFTEKVDGTNIVVHFDEDGMPLFGGRTKKSEIPGFLMDELRGMFSVSPEMAGLTLYGEGYGKKIQKVGSLYLDGHSFVLFDVLSGDVWLERENVVDIAGFLGINVVPIVGSGTINEAVEFVKRGFNSTWGDFVAEGLVIRPEVELRSRRGGRIISKIKHKDFNNG